DSFGHRLDFVWVRYVGLLDLSLAAFGRNLIGNRLGRILATNVIDDDASAVFRKLARDSRPDSTRASRDQCHFSVYAPLRSTAGISQNQRDLFVFDKRLRSHRALLTKPRSRFRKQDVVPAYRKRGPCFGHVASVDSNPTLTSRHTS